MASNTLTSNSISSTYTQILHIGTGTAGVATVRLGDGTATALSFVSGGAKVTGTFEATGNATIGGTLTVTGAITGLGVPVYRRLTADVAAPTTTQVALTELSFTPVNGAIYEVEMMLVAQSVATGTGVQIVNSGGSGTLVMAEPTSQFGISAVGGTYAATSAPAANTNFGILMKGTFTASSTSPLAFDIKSEVASSQVTAKFGSYLKITRIA
jgi:hypothetical protein